MAGIIHRLIGMRQRFLLKRTDGRECVVNRLPLIVMVVGGRQLLKPNENCGLELLYFFQQMYSGHYR